MKKHNVTTLLTIVHDVVEFAIFPVISELRQLQSFCLQIHIRDSCLQDLFREVVRADITTDSNSVSASCLDLVDYCLGLHFVQATERVNS